jgi:Ca-activated chloride channel family protein
MKKLAPNYLPYESSLLYRLYFFIFYIAISAFFIFSCHYSYGQPSSPQGCIKGVISDPNKEGLIGAAVQILDPHDKTTGRGTSTDIDGNFVLTNLSQGSYDLKFSSVGMDSKIIKGVILKTDSSVVLLKVLLNNNSNKLKECVVTCYKVPLISKYETRIEKSITRENIKNSVTTSVENAASQSVGVTQTDAGKGIVINGSRTDETQYIINGHRQIGKPNIPITASRQSRQNKSAGNDKEDSAEPDMAPVPVVVSPSTPAKPDTKSTAEYKSIIENGFKGAAGEPISTFSIDVDAASYSIMRRMVLAGILPPADAMRAEEMINYFPYSYPQPEGKVPFAINTELAECPWNKNHQLLKIGIQGRTVAEEKMPPANLVFLVDVSGSMMSPERLPLVQYALNLLVDKMRPKDHISLVAYAGNAGLVLPSTPGDQKDKIKEAINGLEAGGSTAGGAGIALAYKVAEKNFIKRGNNRIILFTDGDFNVGISSNQDLESMIEDKRKSGVFLSAIGVGTDNYKDRKMEILADKGNGNYSYLDDEREAQKIMVTQMGGTILTIAKDVKIQTVFNPAIVKSYRLIGYEDRKLNTEDFKNDKIDAGEIGSGAGVTALYEIVTGESTGPSLVSLPDREKVALSANDLMSVRVRYKAPHGNASSLIERRVTPGTKALTAATEDFRFASAVASYTMLMRGSQYKGDYTYDKVRVLAQSAIGRDEHGYRSEFIDLVKRASKLSPEVALR